MFNFPYSDLAKVDIILEKGHNSWYLSSHKNGVQKDYKPVHLQVNACQIEYKPMHVTILFGCILYPFNC